MSEYQRQFYRVAELAAAINVSDRTIYRWIDRGAITAVKIGWQARIPVAEYQRVTTQGVDLHGERRTRTP